MEKFEWSTHWWKICNVREHLPFFRFTIYVTNIGQIEQSPNTTKIFDRPGYGGPTTVSISNCISGIWTGRAAISMVICGEISLGCLWNPAAGFRFQIMICISHVDAFWYWYWKMLKGECREIKKRIIYLPSICSQICKCVVVVDLLDCGSAQSLLVQCVLFVVINHLLQRII